MVNGHSDSAREKPLSPLHGLHFSNSGHVLLLLCCFCVVVFYAPPHIQDITYHGCVTLAETRNRSIGNNYLCLYLFNEVF